MGNTWSVVFERQYGQGDRDQRVKISKVKGGGRDAFEIRCAAIE